MRINEWMVKCQNQRGFDTFPTSTIVKWEWPQNLHIAEMDIVIMSINTIVILSMTTFLLVILQKWTYLVCPSIVIL